MVVEAEINPLTYELVKKNRTYFKDDIIIQQLLDTAEYRGQEFGYVVCAFEAELRNNSVMEMAKNSLDYMKQTIIRMHKFVIKLLEEK